MSDFSRDMRQTVLELCKELGNVCTLEHVTYGNYDPATGKTPETITEYKTYSAQSKKLSVDFGLTGANTNLSGMHLERIIVPWVGAEVDTTWKYNGQNITNVSSLESDNEVIYYELAIGDKDNG